MSGTEFAGAFAWAVVGASLLGGILPWFWARWQRRCDLKGSPTLPALKRIYERERWPL